MGVSSNVVVVGFCRWQHEAAADGQAPPPTDIHVATSGGWRIPAHSNVLASASAVLENAVYATRRHWKSERVVQILGVPCGAVVAFLQFLYSSSSRTSLSSKEGKEAIERYGIHLLALSHKYGVEWLKRGCEAGLAERLSAAVEVVDVLRVAKLCNASRLYQRCMRLISEDFASVQQLESWRFVQKNDPRLELEILQFLQDTDQRKKRWRRQRADLEMYRQLAEATECLQHVCTAGCTAAVVGHRDKDPHPSENRGHCTTSSTCVVGGLQLLARHFASCSRRLDQEGGGCPHCKRMWQLFRLHSFLCDQYDSCKVPLCRQFKMKRQMEGKGDDATWRLLAKKVATARVMSSLAKRKRPEHVQKPFQRYRGGRW
ncbi:BTB/POZ and TAZ domain-containing protein 2-like [Iris pallida]|uniref:BTB/POZ and TAZ domain-containing protein 2-like n=1 Tax=Iris pallida TaxID=29817 RepID=A0AAX6HLH4_IRIPA|nr:BTB/POZ and TAZ domain-containing protein 2-like [Iris pallida]